MKDKQLFILLIGVILLINQSTCRVTTTTQYDGVTSNSQFNQYLRFKGNTGIQIDDQSSIQSVSTYTFSMWFRLLADTPTSVGENFMLLSAESAFDLSLTKSGKLQCLSYGGSQYSIDGAIRNYNWYIILLRSQSGKSSFQLREQSFTTVFSQDSSSRFFPFGKSTLSINKMTYGMKSNGQGFYGNLRNIKFVASYLDDSVAQKIQYVYLYPYRDLLLYQAPFMQNDTDGINSGKLVGKESSLPVELDYTGVFWCFQPPTYSYFTFSSSYTLPNVNLNSDATSTSLQMWVWRKYYSASSLSTDENLFEHGGILRLYMSITSDDSHKKLNVIGQNDYGSVMTLSEFRYNRWIFLQIQNSPTYLEGVLYEIDGYQLDSQALTKSSSSSSEGYVQIGRDFQGYIFGIKYFTQYDPSTKGPHTFKLKSESNTFFYYILTSQGLSSSSFTNYGSFSNGASYDSSKVTWKSNFANPQYDNNGTLNTALLFDGYTCSDSKDKLYFPSKTVSVQTSVPISSSVNQYTLEFWIRQTYRQSGSAMIASLMDNYRLLSSNQIYTAIVQESDNSLSCYPYYTKDSENAKVKYLDYAYDSQTWVHITCVYDGISKVVSGYIYYSNVNYAYYSDISSLGSSANLPARALQLTLNTNPISNSKGMDKIYMSEVRVWKTKRTTAQISDNRFQQINIDNERSNVFVYLKLLSGYTTEKSVVKEIDYANSNYSTKTYPTYSSSLTWQSLSDIVFCPVGMFKGDQKDLNCYREGIVTFQLVVYKTLTSYVISAEYSKFRSTYVKDNSYLIYDYAWSLTSIDSTNKTNAAAFPNYLSSQKSQQELQFKFEQVSDKTGKYVLKLSMQDERNQQNTYSGSITLKTFRCANLYDKDTQLGMVQKDMDSEKNKENAVFYYQYSDCGDYKFDQSSMKYTIDISGVNIVDADHDKSAQSITLRSSMQGNIPLNEYFYLKIKGVWKNTKDSSDIVEYYLIYACRYVSKLVVKLSPNYKLLLKGQTLNIDYTAKFYNMKTAISDPTYTLNWTCPDQISKYCSSQTGSLKLNYEFILNSGLEFWKPYQISINAYTNFIQGDGLKYSNASVNIIWMDVNPDARMFLTSTYLNKFYHLSYQLDINSLSEDILQIKWDSSPSFSSSCLINSNDRKQFVVNSTCLTEGQTYTVSSKIIYSMYSQQIWSSSQTVTISKAPSGGKLTCTPTSAKANMDLIKCSTSGWTISNSPAKYQFFTQDKSTSQMTATSPVQSSSEFIGYFPATSIISVKVTDSQEAYSTATTSVNIVIDSNSTKYQELLINALTLANKTYKSFDTQLIQNLTYTANVLASLQSKISQSQYSEYCYQISTNLLYQAQRLNQFTRLRDLQATTNEKKKTFFLGALQIIYTLTNVTNYLDCSVMDQFQQTIAILTNKTDLISIYKNDNDFKRNFFNSQSNQLKILKSMKNNGQLTGVDNSTEGDLNNITSTMRQIFTTFETYLSTTLYESESYSYNTSNFNFMVKKYSRIANSMVNQTQKNGLIEYTFPLGIVTQPSDRQSFTQIMFKDNPFTGASYLDQTATSDGAVYFAYRDQYGRYLDASNVKANIKMVFAFKYSPFIFLPNSTVCGYINTYDSNWENSSCTTVYSRSESIITCYCKHMSYYSIIDDYLIRPPKIPIIVLVFKNWASFIVLLYLLMIFIIGFIYTFNKDNQDFRYLHYQEELQGNELVSQDSIGLVSLAFKRQVFYMDFAQKYKFTHLYRIYMMCLHPLFQLKYRMDPQIPRFYRFQLLFTRIVIMFGISFFTLRDFKNLGDIKGTDEFTSAIVGLFIFSFIGSLIFLPLPLILLGIVKSRYYLINPKSANNKNSDYEENNIDRDPSQDLLDRITDICIDTTIPLKLLFLVNATSHEKLQKEYYEKMAYASGNSLAVAEKLYELDPDIIRDNELQAERKLNKGTTNKKKSLNHQTITERGLNQNDNEIHTLGAIGQQDATPQTVTPNDKRRGSKYAATHGEIQEFNAQSDDFSQILNNKKSPNKSQAPMLDISDIEIEAKKNTINVNETKKEKRRNRKRNAEKQEQKQQPTHQRGVSSLFENVNIDDELDGPSNIRKDINFEGGEDEEAEEYPHNQNNNDRNEDKQGTGHDESESNLSIDTNLFIDEKKELIEIKNYFGRLVFNVIAGIVNIGIIIAMLVLYVSQGYYNQDNPYVWVLAFFGSQLIAFLVTDNIALLIMAKIVTKWCWKKKTCLALTFQESLYIYEDYKYTVQFVQTKIS